MKYSNGRSFKEPKKNYSHGSNVARKRCVYEFIEVFVKMVNTSFFYINTNKIDVKLSITVT